LRGSSRTVRFPRMRMPPGFSFLKQNPETLGVGPMR
jgi:hypothetical protein